MLGVSGGIQGGETQLANFNCFAILDYGQPLARHRKEFSPQGVHLIAINTLRAAQELIRNQQVWGANRVNMDTRSVACQPSGCTGVIEMDVSKEDVRDVLRGEAMSLQAGYESLKGRPWSAFYQDCALCMWDQVRCDGARNA
jgi:hypothetical protein